MSNELKDKKYRPQFHIAPPQGWLNDPNGLCQMDGIHHIFFQYSPDNPRGGDKYWGHYETADFVNYDFTGILLSPDTPEDKDGVYSGCAYTENGTMYLYYTGNVKHPGDYDYIYQGREANTILVTSRDGKSASPKEVLLKSADYPATLSNHVRDPKVIFKDGRYYMVLGARTKEDHGCVLLYTSDNKKNWTFDHYIKKDDFGYMWECPDLFTLEGRQFLSVSPQGLKSEAYRYQNVYQSGYFSAAGDLLTNECQLEDFTEWDLGFDFYAPQTYMDERGRRILIGWMGVPDAEYDHDPSIDEGWQHMLTIPRELICDEDHHRILQNPVQEMTELRDQLLTEEVVDLPKSIFLTTPYELLLSDLNGNDFELTFDDDLHFSYESKTGFLELSFGQENGAEGFSSGFGRTSRKHLIPEGEKITDIRVFVDTCCIEIFANHGAYVFTTKYFTKEPSHHTATVHTDRAGLKIYGLKPACFKTI